MPWLNWSLKLHIRLRTISLLISTHNIQVYVQWMPCSMNAIFICVIVFDKMCFHMLNLCRFKHKKIFECFSCFWKVFCSYKKLKISKTVLPCFGDSVAGQTSRMPQSQAHRSVLATCSRVEGPVSRGTQRFSWLSSRLPCEWDF